MGDQLRTTQGRRTEFVGTIAGKSQNLHQESCRFRLAEVFADHRGKIHFWPESSSSTPFQDDLVIEEPHSRSSLPFIESKIFSEKTGRRLVLTSHRVSDVALKPTLSPTCRYDIPRERRCASNARASNRVAAKLVGDAKHLSRA